MNKYVGAFAGFAALVGVTMMSDRAEAIGITGSAGLTFQGVVQDGANLGVSTQFTFQTIGNGNNSLQVGLNPSGDYATAPSSAGIFLSTITLDLVTQSFSYTTPTGDFGSFGNISTFTVVQQTSNFLDVFIIGDFTPDAGAGTPLSTRDVTPTSLRISLNQSGQTISGGITQNSPPADIPEPATLALLGAGLVGLGMARRRKA